MLPHDLPAIVLVDGLRLVRFRELVIVQAKPLRELGFGGVLGTVVAFICAYGCIRLFLRWPYAESN